MDEIPQFRKWNNSVKILYNAFSIPIFHFFQFLPHKFKFIVTEQCISWYCHNSFTCL